MSNKKKKLVISDSSSLILLAKSDLIKTVSKLFDIKIPGEVYKESVTEGKKKQREDAFIIEREIQNHRIDIVKTEHKEKINEVIRSFNLGKGEQESIALYLQLGADLLLTDDKKAITTSRVLKIRWATVPNLLPLLIQLNEIKRDKALDSLAKLQKYGRYRLDYLLEIENNIRNRK